MEFSPITPALLRKYVADKCTAEEKERILNYLATREGQVHIRRLMDQEEQLTNSNQQLDPEVTHRILSRLRSSIHTQPTSTRRNQRNVNIRFNPAIWRVAASVIIIVGIGLGIYQFESAVKPIVVAIEDTIFPITYIEKTAPANQQVKLTLADGTKIWLNGGSAIAYPKQFIRRDKREIRLKGEAYFEVAKNRDKPFFITTRQGIIRVIGTAFNIKENTHDTTLIVAVREGMVSLQPVNTTTNQPTKLSAGNVGMLKGKKVRTTVSNDIANYLSWFNSRLIFNHTQLAEVARQLEHLYGVEITLTDNSLHSLKLSGEMSRKDIQVVMDQIALSLNIKYKLKEKKILLFR